MLDARRRKQFHLEKSRLNAIQQDAIKRITYFSALVRYQVCAERNWPRGPFLESPGNSSGPKSNIQIET